MNQLELNLDPINCDICGGEIEPDRTPEGEVYWTQGNDAHPITEGRACNDCNATKVIPARLKGALLNEAEDRGFNKNHLDKHLEVVVID